MMPIHTMDMVKVRMYHFSLPASEQSGMVLNAQPHGTHSAAVCDHTKSQCAATPQQRHSNAATQAAGLTDELAERRIVLLVLVVVIIAGTIA